MNEFILDTIEFLSRTRNKIKKAVQAGDLTTEQADAAWALYHDMDAALQNNRPSPC